MKPLTSTHISTPHGFFTREGGVSTGIFAALNCGPGSGDDQGKVRENRSRVAAHFGRTHEDLLTLYQCHSAKAVSVHAPLPPGTEADALVTATPGLVLGILTADCAPVLLYDAGAKVAAAAHAGWKGAVGGILQSTVEHMAELGARTANIHAAIGPCIAQGSYEVGPEFVERLLALEERNARFFLPSAHEGKAFFDLKSYVKDALQALGVHDISMVGGDTCAEEKTFFSYRRATLRKEPSYGRQISCIIIEN